MTQWAIHTVCHGSTVHPNQSTSPCWDRTLKSRPWLIHTRPPLRHEHRAPRRQRGGVQNTQGPAVAPLRADMTGSLLVSPVADAVLVLAAGQCNRQCQCQCQCDFVLRDLVSRHCWAVGAVQNGRSPTVGIHMLVGNRLRSVMLPFEEVQEVWILAGHPSCFSSSISDGGGLLPVRISYLPFHPPLHNHFVGI